MERIVVGAKVTILDGVKIGNHCVVAAGAVVTSRSRLFYYCWCTSKINKNISEASIQITVVHYGNDYSGASVVLSNIINCLENKNIKVYYLSVPGIRGFYISPDIGICYGQRTTTRGNLAGIFSLFYNQFILFLRLSCDHFIHSNSKLIVNGILNFGALIYALIFRVDLVVYVHELNTNKYLLMFLLPLVKLAATQIICVSNFQKNKLFPHAQNCHVLYNCVNKNLLSIQIFCFVPYEMVF